MRTIDDILNNNAGILDTEEPPEGHFTRFKEKLQATGKTSRIKPETLLFRIAAILIIGLFLSTLIYKGIDFYSPSSDDSCPNRELCEAEVFYTRQVAKYYDQIRNLPFKDDSQTRREILNELREMDVQVAGMKEDLKQNPDDERIIYTIINYYQEKIDFMNMVIIRTTESENTIL